MGQYGGGVEGNSAADGEMCKLAVFATMLVVGAEVVGGIVAGGVVVAADRSVVATITVVVATGWTVVVGPDECAVGSARCCEVVGEAATRGVS